MATLKRQKEDGNWEFLQMTGEDVITLKNDVAEHLAEKATTTKVGHVQLSSAVDSVDEAKAATPKAVKISYDKAVSAEVKVDELKKYLDDNFRSETIELTADENIMAGDGVQLNNIGHLQKTINRKMSIEFPGDFVALDTVTTATDTIGSNAIMVDSRPMDTIFMFRRGSVSTMHVEYQTIDKNGNLIKFEPLNTGKSAVTNSTNYLYSAIITEDDRLVLLCNVNGTTTDSSAILYVLQINRDSKTLAKLSDAIPVTFYGTQARISYLGNNKFFFYRATSSSSTASYGAVATLNVDGIMTFFPGKSLHTSNKPYESQILVVNNTTVMLQTEDRTILTIKIEGTSIGDVKKYMAVPKFLDFHLLDNMRILALSPYEGGKIAIYELNEFDDLIELDTLTLYTGPNSVAFKPTNTSNVDCSAIVFDESTYGVMYSIIEPYIAKAMTNVHFDHSAKKFVKREFNNKTDILTTLTNGSNNIVVVNDAQSDSIIARTRTTLSSINGTISLFIGKQRNEPITGIALKNTVKGQKCQVAITGFVYVYTNLEIGKMYDIRNGKLAEEKDINKAIGIATGTDELLLLRGVI